jgi:hypothetical protein
VWKGLDAGYLATGFVAVTLTATVETLAPALILLEQILLSIGIQLERKTRELIALVNRVEY